MSAMQVIPKEGKPSTVAPTTRAGKIATLVALGKSMDTEFKSTNSLIRLGDRANVPVPSLCLNLPSVDQYLLACGGVPRGRVIEVFGPESAGKTTVTLDWIAQFQKAGDLAAFVDAEHALDPQYAKILGVDTDNLFFNQPDHGEQALQVVEQLIDSRAVGIIVVDSVAALVPKAELEGEIGDSHMGLQARLMSQALRILTGKVARSNTTLVFINQIRDKIGVVFGNPETTTGGKALKFYSSVRVDVRRTKAIGAGGNTKEFGDGDKSAPIGHRIKLKTVKNKVGPPLRETEIDLLYDSGIDRIGDMITLGDKLKIFDKSGAWYSLNGERLGNGAAAAKEAIRDNAAWQSIIQAAIYNKLNPPEEAKEEPKVIEAKIEVKA